MRKFYTASVQFSFAIKEILMAEEKDTTIQAAPVVKQEEKDEFEEKVIVDPIEKSYGDPEKATKTVRVKKEPKPQVKAEPKESVAEFRQEESKEKKSDDTTAAPKAEAVAEKAEPAKIETPISAQEWNDPLSVTVSKDAVQDKKVKAEEKAVSKTPEQLQEEIIAPELKKKAEAWDKFIATPTGKFVVEVIEAGGDPVAALAEAQPKDYAGMEAQAVMKDYFSKIEGLEGDELTSAIDEHFDEGVTTGNQRRKAEREARTALDYRQQNVLNKLKTDAINNKTKGQEIHNQFISDVEDEVEESYVKKPAYGIKLTTDQAKALKDDAKNIFKRLINPDGTVNAKLAAFYIFSEQHRGTLRKNDYLKGNAEGMETALIAAHQPDRMENGISAPSKASKETLEQQIDRNYGASKSN